MRATYVVPNTRMPDELPVKRTSGTPNTPYSLQTIFLPLKK